MKIPKIIIKYEKNITINFVYFDGNPILNQKCSVSNALDDGNFFESSVLFFLSRRAMDVIFMLLELLSVHRLHVQQVYRYVDIRNCLHFTS
jgi:hypothetical protein